MPCVPSPDPQVQIFMEMAACILLLAATWARRALTERKGATHWYYFSNKVRMSSFTGRPDERRAAYSSDPAFNAGESALIQACRLSRCTKTITQPQCAVVVAVTTACCGHNRKMLWSGQLRSFFSTRTPALWVNMPQPLASQAPPGVNC